MDLMKVVKKDKPGRGITLTTAEIPVPEAGEVLIKVKTAGICGTDLHIYKWDKWSQSRLKPPVILGHEFVGEICAVGSGLNHYKEGQRVTAEGHITCGHCKFCRNGKGHICQDVEIIGIDRDGCFAEYIKMPEANIWRVDDEIPDKYAAIFDPLGNAMHTVMAESVAFKTVLITGAGAIGLFAIPIAKTNGAERVIVVEPNPMKREIAMRVGADLVLDSSSEGVEEKIMEFTRGLGPDVLLEMSGNSGAFKMGLDVLGKGGTANLLGIPGNQVLLDVASQIIFKGITIHGITGRKMYETWYQCESFLSKNASIIDPIITHFLEVDNIEDGFIKMESNEAVKVLLKIS